MDFDTAVKLNIYETVANTTKLPTASEVASALGSTFPEVEAAFERLYQKRLPVLEPGSPAHIRMAPPFSGVETQHLVKIEDKTYFANCAWDAFGIAAALKREADIISSCPDCGELLSFQIRNGRPLPQEAIAHFTVPAAQWWRDIIHTSHTMLFFRSEDHVDRWCETQELPKRPIISLDQLWQLAVTWYANRLTLESRRPGPDEMVKIFSGIGLEGPFWNPKSDRWSPAA